jgi:hypothetical protein
MLRRCRRARRTVAAALIAASSASCSNVLGLDRGVPEVDAATGDPSDAPDGASGMRESAASTDGAAAGDAQRAPGPQDGGVGTEEDGPGGADAQQDAGSGEEQAPFDSGPGSEAGCRAPLQPCTVGPECCSGVCGISLTCL